MKIVLLRQVRGYQTFYVTVAFLRLLCYNFFCYKQKFGKVNENEK